MRKFYLLLLVIISIAGNAQEVTTILDSQNADVDDALIIDSKGNLYGSNFIGSTVYKITPSGEVSAFITGLKHPNGLAFDSEENLFVSEYGASIIHKYDKDGNLVQSYPVDGVPSGMVKSRYRNTIIYTDVRNNSINELLSDGTVKELYKGEPLNIPVGLTFDRKGTLYIGNYLDRKIYRLTSRNSEPEYVATVPDSGTDFPYLAFITYARGYVYGTNYGEHKIYKINPRAVDDVEIFAGSTNGNNDGDISEATFSYPAGIIANRSGNALFVSEFSGVGNIRKISNRRERCDFNIRLKTYPNPVSDELNIAVRLPEVGSFNIKVYDFYGRNLIYQSTEVSEEENFLKTISVKDWSSGLYILQVSKGSCKGYRIVLIKQP
ncbi:T9SS type A sorting domain-containing protein [Aquimarina sp. 2201CG5-10]|uniref:T9SS type A sorting domain-containing protein n=1 Tax=Aquimarina callyspongiae TaxID=3098150 RepID=UPI002AB5620B|nr:T9SS type A sorting domain-containing protein [Aquimarina sp. 2201CG5-10]MDY8136221.1 T9SS type A sorting domain-containing protein [Aquimarina sp. 2201CG5-10]